MSSDTTNSTPPRNLSGIQAQNNEPIISNGEAGYYSSPPSSPGPEDERPSFFFQQEKQLSLGVYFSADEGENNDVIAALKAGQRVIKETADLLMVCLVTNILSCLLTAFISCRNTVPRPSRIPLSLPLCMRKTENSLSGSILA